MAKWNRWDPNGQENANNQNGQNNQNGEYSSYDQNANSGSGGAGEDYAFKTVMNDGRRKTFGWSITSLVLGILSVVCCCLGWAGAIFAIGAIVFAVVARKTLGYFDGLAIAGLVLGIFGAVFSISIIISTMLLPDEFWDSYYEEFENGTLPGGNI